MSDDRFEYFIGWLILRGREGFETVVADPDSLAEIVGEHDRGDLSYEGYPGCDAWIAATGSSGGVAGWEAFVAAGEARHGEYHRIPQLDEELWLDDHEQLRRRLPSLAARLLEPRSPHIQ